MKKFLGKLFTFALYTFVIGAIGKAAYDMFGDTDKLKKEAELVDRYENFVPEEVSPYAEDPDGTIYYYKSIGGEFYAGQSWEIEGIPSFVTMSGDGFDEKDINQYFSYDEKVHTFIISEELLSTLENGYYHINVYYDEELSEEFGFRVEDELVNNVPAQYAFRGDNINKRIYNKLADKQELSLYFSNVGDNRIVDVLICNEGSILGVVDPDDYIIAPAGNKVTLKKEYLQSLLPNNKKEYGVRLADGTIVYEPWTNFWTIKDKWTGCIMDGVKDYSLSEGGDFVINLIRNDTDKISSLVIALTNSDEDIRYVEMLDLDWGGCANFKSGGNTIIITEDIMKTLPVNTELNIGLYFCFDYDRKNWCGENIRFKVVP